jgi:hypothetical protein
MAKESWALCAVRDVDTKADKSEYRDPRGLELRRRVQNHGANRLAKTYLALAFVLEHYGYLYTLWYSAPPLNSVINFLLASTAM